LELFALLTFIGFLFAFCFRMAAISAFCVLKVCHDDWLSSWFVAWYFYLFFVGDTFLYFCGELMLHGGFSGRVWFVFRLSGLLLDCVVVGQVWCFSSIVVWRYLWFFRSTLTFLALRGPCWSLWWKWEGLSMTIMRWTLTVFTLSIAGHYWYHLATIWFWYVVAAGGRLCLSLVCSMAGVVPVFWCVFLLRRVARWIAIS